MKITHTIRLRQIIAFEIESIISIICIGSYYPSLFLACCFTMESSSEDYISEGKARIFSGSNVFYNPVQEFNRDMSVLSLTVFVELFGSESLQGKAVKRRNETSSNDDTSHVAPEAEKDGIVVLEALAATGLRSIRYALEVPNLKSVLANDFSTRAVETISRNAKENGVEHIVNAVNHDAIWLMQKLNFENKHVQVIDLDPYGCPTRFLDSAVNCISDGGLLMITCTDMAVIAGNTPETCYVKYGSVSLRSCACHEMALRIALSCLSSHCGRYGKYVVPLLSISADFYIRIFVRVFSSQKICKQVSSRTSLVYQCTGCEMTALQPLGLMTPKDNNFKFSLPVGLPVLEKCLHCGHKCKTGGPIWSAPLHDLTFVNEMLSKLKDVPLATSKRISGMLSLIREELPDVPLYYTVDSLCSKLHCQMIPLIEFKSALLNAGYRVSSSHCKSNSVKTDAPNSIIWDVLRCWVRKYPVSGKRLQERSVTASILNVIPIHEADFAFCKSAVPQSTVEGLLRYQPNPMPNWGPGTRSKSNILLETTSQKQLRNQNKKSQMKKTAGQASIDSLLDKVPSTTMNEHG